MKNILSLSLLPEWFFSGILHIGLLYSLPEFWLYPNAIWTLCMYNSHLILEICVCLHWYVQEICYPKLVIVLECSTWLMIWLHGEKQISYWPVSSIATLPPVHSLDIVKWLIAKIDRNSNEIWRHSIDLSLFELLIFSLSLSL